MIRDILKMAAIVFIVFMGKMLSIMIDCDPILCAIYIFVIVLFYRDINREFK